MTLSRETLQQLVDRVVRTARPERIILFGSAARGTMTPQSDIDLLVIKSGAFDRAKFGPGVQGAGGLVRRGAKTHRTTTRDGVRRPVIKDREAPEATAGGGSV